MLESDRLVKADFAACFAWIAAVAPLQYLGNLVAGASARLALEAPVRTYAGGSW